MFRMQERTQVTIFATGFGESAVERPAPSLEEDRQNHITMTIRFQIEHIQETYEYAAAGRPRPPESRIASQMWNGASSADRTD